MNFIKLTSKENSLNYMYFIENKFEVNDDLFHVNTYTHTNIPFEGLVFLFNTDPDSHYYVRQILFYRLKIQSLVKTEENENLLLEIVPDYFTSNDFDTNLLITKFNILREPCKGLIRKMYDLFVSLIRIVDPSVLHLYYEDISKLRNVESSDILNYMFAFYEQEMTELYKDIVIPEYIDKYYKVKSKILRKVMLEHESNDVRVMATYPTVVDLFENSQYIGSNHPYFLLKKEELNMSDSLYNSLFIDAFNLQKQYI